MGPLNHKGLFEFLRLQLGPGFPGQTLLHMCGGDIIFLTGGPIIHKGLIEFTRLRLGPGFPGQTLLHMCGGDIIFLTGGTHNPQRID